MTKDEIRVVTFVIVALLIGVAWQWWGTRPPPSQNRPPTPAPRGWAKPPYVFKNRKEMEKTAKDVKAAEPSASE